MSPKIRKTKYEEYHDVNEFNLCFKLQTNCKIDFTNTHNTKNDTMCFSLNYKHNAMIGIYLSSSIQYYKQDADTSPVELQKHPYRHFSMRLYIQNRLTTISFFN